MVHDYFHRLQIKARDQEEQVRNLSGGNQQKTVLARWLATAPRLLILDEPTHGIDVGAKNEIYDLIRKLAAEGLAIALISSEMPEIIAMADRCAVMCEGRLVTILERDHIDEDRILRYATGVTKSLGL